MDRLDITILIAACFLGFLVNFGFYAEATAYSFVCLLIVLRRR